MADSDHVPEFPKMFHVASAFERLSTHAIGRGADPGEEPERGQWTENMYRDERGRE
jgi:hypothetical protein